MRLPACRLVHAEPASPSFSSTRFLRQPHAHILGRSGSSAHRLLKGCTSLRRASATSQCERGCCDPQALMHASCDETSSVRLCAQDSRTMGCRMLFRQNFLGGLAFLATPARSAEPACNGDSLSCLGLRCIDSRTIPCSLLSRALSPIRFLQCELPSVVTSLFICLNMVLEYYHNSQRLINDPADSH